jgi:hypothetical protein
MKIISKFKDYYDYLQGIYGVDTNLVLDRTLFTKIPNSIDDYTLVRFHICNNIVEGIWYGGKVLYGKDIEQISYNYCDNPKLNQCYSDEDKYYIYNPNQKKKYGRYSITKVLKEPKKVGEDKSQNIKTGCAILLIHIRYPDNDECNSMNPILSEYNLVNVYTPLQIWIMLSEWLGKQKDSSSKYIDKSSDIEKLVNKGFDKKTSFRNM